MKTLEMKRAIVLRKRGYSIGEIAKEVNASKGSVSNWVKDIKLSPRLLERLKSRPFANAVVEKRRKTRIAKEQLIRQGKIEFASGQIRAINQYDLKLIGSALYWAEGSKTKRSMVRVSNSDPDFIKTMMKFFTEICRVPQKKFRIYIHIHSPKAVNEAEKYWSKITGVSYKQFYKTYVAKSSATKNKRETLPMGTCEINICDTNLFLQITGWIKAFKDLIT